jgi:quercetin dioxygenase-like cupin family protein
MTEYPYPAHVHAVAEVIIQIQGYALVTIDEVQYRLTPGDAAVIFPWFPIALTA